MICLNTLIQVSRSLKGSGSDKKQWYPAYHRQQYQTTVSYCTIVLNWFLLQFFLGTENIELTDVCLNWFIFLEHMLNNVTHILMVIIKGKVDKI